MAVAVALERSLFSPWEVEVQAMCEVKEGEAAEAAEEAEEATLAVAESEVSKAEAEAPVPGRVAFVPCRESGREQIYLDRPSIGC